MPQFLRTSEPRGPGGTRSVGVDHDAVDGLLTRIRWFAAALIALQFVLLSPPFGAGLPYSTWWGALPAGQLLVVNAGGLVLRWWHRRAGGATPGEVWAVTQLVADAAVVVVLLVMFTYDSSTALWGMLVIPVLEAGIRGWRGRALISFGVMGVVYVLSELLATQIWAGRTVMLASITYRIGTLAIMAGCVVGLAARLTEQIGRTTAAQREVDQLRAVAVATRRMSSLDVPTVVRELTAAAQAFGFDDVQLRPKAALTEPGRSPAGSVTSGAWFAEAVEAVGTAGYAVIEPTAEGEVAGMAVAPDQVVVVAPVTAGHEVEALLLARHPRPIETRDIEALTLLAGQAGAVLANALRYEEGRAFEERLAHQSTHDALTGLPNRALLRDRARTAVARSRRQNTLVAVMIIDVDRFKEVNDVLGHAIGDSLLRQVAERLCVDLRLEDTCARVGGDEFVVVSGDHEDAEAVMDLGRRLLSSLSEPFHLETTSLDIEASIGVAWSPDHGEDIDVLLREADVAMCAAKERREGIVVYQSADDQLTPSHLATLGDLRRALESEGQLTALFQPIVSVATERLVAVEALVRWQHPSRGQVSPAEFIPLAEETSIIHQITDHVLDLALGSMDRWLARGLDIHLAVNLSTRTLLDVSLIQRLESLLERHGVPPDRLRLEITEGTLLADPTRSIATMHRLKDLGLRLSIDDFGTGYASMSYLKSLPVDELKIDRLFVSDMLRSTRDGAMVNSVIDLAHGLGLHVVAEGVEDQDTLDALCFVGCDLAQGYLVGRPMTADALYEWAAARGDLDHRPDHRGPRAYT